MCPPSARQGHSISPSPVLLGTVSWDPQATSHPIPGQSPGLERAGNPGSHILTKNSKLKRKRKYLVTLMQAAPILQLLELPGEREARGAGDGGRLETGGGHSRAESQHHHPQTQSSQPTHKGAASTVPALHDAEVQRGWMPSPKSHS